MNGMGQKLGVVYTVVTVVFFVILAVIFVLRLNLARDENSSAASANLQIIRQTAREAYSNPSISNDRFRATMRQISARTPSLEVVIVYSYSGGTDYLWARNKSFLPQNVQDISRSVGIPQLQYSELTALKITDSFDTVNSRTYFVTGLYTVIGDTDIYPLLRDTLVLILLYALVALLITILVMVTSSQHRPAPRRTAALLDPYAPAPYTERPHTGTETAESDQSPAAGSRAPATTAVDQPTSPPVRTMRTAGNGESAPEGLISPRTGLSYRDHLERRLTLELERAAFNEQDLSVILVRFPGLREHSDLHNAAAALVLSHFAFEDLAFEYDDESFFVIIPNAELNAGIRSAEAFQKKTVPFARQHQLSSPCIGLSSRNGRLTDGPQLIKESRQACSKAAREQGMRIVGFHPDPQRYRAYIAERNL